MPNDAADPHKGQSMQVQIDGESRLVNLEGLANFGELMERIERELVVPGRVVTGLALNEEDLSMDQEQLLYGFGLEHIASLRLETAEPRNLAIDSLIHATDYLPALSAGLESSATSLRQGRMEEGLGRLDASLDLLQHFLAVLDGVRSVLQLDFAQVILDPDEGGSVATLQNRLEQRVRELLAAAESEDWNLAGEIATYELSPLTYQFIAAMPLLLEAAVRIVPEYRSELSSRASQIRHALNDELWDQEDEDLSDFVDEDDDPEAEAAADDEDVDVSASPKKGNGHSRPDRHTEALIDDLEDEWEPERPGRPSTGEDGSPLN